jgi:hypothetical protein
MSTNTYDYVAYDFFYLVSNRICSHSSSTWPKEILAFPVGNHEVDATIRSIFRRLVFPSLQSHIMPFLGDQHGVDIDCKGT